MVPALLNKGLEVLELGYFYYFLNEKERPAEGLESSRQLKLIKNQEREQKVR